MKWANASVFFLVLAVSALVLLSPSATADARKPMPVSDPARGLVYTGLQVTDSGVCKAGFVIKVPGRTGKPLCTPGPDPMPVKRQAVAALAQAASGAGATSPAAKGSVACDGDGVSGKRVQVVYAYPATMASRFAEYRASLQQWAAEVDSLFDTSALQTGSSRRVRYVTDKNCYPAVAQVQLSATGAASFGNTISELYAQGYGRADRKYMVFVDAQVYCGISSMEYDDSPGATNYSNLGPSYARIDRGCWSGEIAAHELMHTLGGVQMTAPNSDGNSHCNDGNDNMCNHSGHPVQPVCTTNTSAALDCNHNDYYNAKPPTGSYLATHWNVANSQFLIVPAAKKK